MQPAGNIPPLAPALPDGQIPRWEEAPLAQEIFLLANLMQRVADRLVAHRNLTASRWLLTAALEHFEHAPSITELANDGLMTPQNVSKLLGSMERDGLIERFTVQGKGRQVFVRLTQRGEHTRQQAKREGRQFARSFLHHIPQDRIDATRDTLDQLIRNTQRLEASLAGQHQHHQHPETHPQTHPQSKPPSNPHTNPPADKP